MTARGGATPTLALALLAAATANDARADVERDAPATSNLQGVHLFQRARFIIPIVEGVVAEVGVEATEPLPRRAFFVAGRPIGMDTVFEQPGTTLAGWGGVGLRWK